MPEGTKLIQIARDGMVLVVALNNLPKPFTYLRWRFMLPADQFCFYRSQLRHHPLAGRFAPYDEAPVAPTLPTIMREAQERKGLWFSLAAPLPVLFGEPPELDQSRLLRMQFQAELRQTLSKLFEKTLGFRPAFEAHHKIVGVADDNHIAPSHFLTPSLYPQVENVMQVHVGEQRRYHCSLRCSYLRLRPLAVLRYPRLEPLLDQAQYPAIGHAVLNELDCPFVRQVVEGPFDTLPTSKTCPSMSGSLAHIIHLRGRHCLSLV